MKPVLVSVWAPVALSLTLRLTFGSDHLLLMLILCVGQFYLAHWAAYRYFAIYFPARKAVYWKSASLAYVPMILSVWIAFLVSGPGSGFDSSSVAIGILGLLGGFVLFAALLVKQIHIDPDQVLGTGFYIFCCQPGDCRTIAVLSGLISPLPTIAIRNSPFLLFLNEFNILFA